jgi:hypothetical protein
MTHARITHSGTVAADEVIAAQDAAWRAIDAREAAAKAATAPVTKSPPVTKVAKPSAPRRATTPAARPALPGQAPKRREGQRPDGSLILSAEEVVALDHLLATHPDLQP